MRITLLGLEFALENLGCEALAYSFASELDAIIQKRNEECQYTAVVFADKSDIKVPESGKKIECLKIRYKDIHFWKNLRKLFKESTFVFDFTGGDSFSDLYGKKRFYMATLIKKMAIASGTVFVLGPQTYGPYHDNVVKRVAAGVIRKSSYVFARDAISQRLAQELSGRDVCLSSDVAFSLPYQKQKYALNSQKIKIGFNPSGLLWRGGYDHARLPLKVDYQQYCFSVLGELAQNPQYEVHLIAHVGTKQSMGTENDYSVCKMLHEKYPKTVLADVFDSPMDAKSYIANMDLFIGARMHATIAAFSSGVATIPFSYSRKFEGLYSGVDYLYVIHACEDSTQKAICQTKEYIEECEKLRNSVAEGMKKIKLLQQGFRDELEKILDERTL